MQIDATGGTPVLPPLGDATRRDAPGDGSSFTDILGNALTELEASQQRADSLVSRMLAGEDIPAYQAILAVEQANLTLQMALQIRNRLLEAYQEVSRTQI